MRLETVAEEFLLRPRTMESGPHSGRRATDFAEALTRAQARPVDEAVPAAATAAPEQTAPLLRSDPTPPQPPVAGAPAQPTVTATATAAQPPQASAVSISPAGGSQTTVPPRPLPTRSYGAPAVAAPVAPARVSHVMPVTAAAPVQPSRAIGPAATTAAVATSPALAPAAAAPRNPIQSIFAWVSNGFQTVWNGLWNGFQSFFRFLGF